MSTPRISLSAVVLALSVACMGQETTPKEKTMIPTAEEIRKAVGQLESTEPAELIAAAEVIAKSDDAAAWEALRKTLVDPEKLKRLEVRTLPRGMDSGRLEDA